MKNYFHSAALLGLVVFAGNACALTDPTRPPAVWLDSVDASTAVDGGGLRLQSVKMPHRGKGVAVISGVTVVMGGKLSEATLIKLSEREAVLQGPDGVTHLYLTPDVEKQMVVTPVSRKSGKVAQRKDSR